MSTFLLCGCYHFPNSKNGKNFSFLTQNAASTLGLTILTGLTVSSSAMGASKIIQSIQVKQPTAAVVKNQVIGQPEQTSDKAKTVILAKIDTTTITPILSSTKTKRVCGKCIA